VNLYDDLNILQNVLINFVSERVSTFPADARRGRVIFHIGLKYLFVCKNGVEDANDTTLIANWVGGKVMIDGMSSEGENRGKILITDGADGYLFGDCDGGTI